MAKQFVVGGAARRERDGFFGCGNRRVKLAALEIGAGKEVVERRVIGRRRGSVIENLDGLRIIANREGVFGFFGNVASGERERATENRTTQKNAGGETSTTTDHPAAPAGTRTRY